MAKFSCESSLVVILVKAAIKTAKYLAILDPSKNKDIVALEKGLKVYKKDCALCKSEGSDIKCMKTAIQKLMRQLAFIRDSVYPWQNYDWDYGNYIDNNYSAMATGSSREGKAYLKNIGIFIKIISAYIAKGNPGKGAKAGGKSKNSDYPIYGCLGNKKKICDATHKVKMSNLQKKPYNDNFFKKKLDGNYASSYYIRVGSCDRNDIKSEGLCKKKGFNYEGGRCYQPRYAYMNNSPGIPGIRGFIPALTADMFSFTPDKMMMAYTGHSVPGQMKVQQCPKIVEKWESYVPIKTQNQVARNIMSVFFAIVMVIVIILCTCYFCTTGEFAAGLLDPDWSLWEYIKENFNPKSLLKFITIPGLMKSYIYVPIIFLNLILIIKIFSKIF
jgi:hypothetical protein